MSIKHFFNLFVVTLALSVPGLTPVSAQDLFNFPDDDPLVEKKDPPAQETPQPQEPNPLVEQPAQDPAVDEGQPGEAQDPLLQDDPLLDGNDDLVVRPNQQGREGNNFQFPNDEEEKPGQTVLLNSKFAGWEQAGANVGGRRLGTELRANWIMVNANGRFTGQVIAAKDANLDGMIVYLTHMGRIVRESVVDANGIFEFSNVAQGPYALVGWADNAFFAFGLNILDFDEQNITKVRNNVRVMAIQNKTTLNNDWIQFYTPKINFRIFGRYREAEGLDDPASLYGVSGLMANLPTAEPATSIDSRPVTRTVSGGMIGRVHQMNSETGRPVDVRATRVLLLQGDDVIAATDTDNYGVFYFPQVAIGQYGLLAAGIDGMGLIGIEVIDNEQESIVMNEVGELVDGQGQAKKQEPYPFDFCLVSAETAGWMNHYASELAYRRNLLAPRRPSPDDQNRMCVGCEGSGCQHCQGTGICTSRGQSFEDWAMNCANQHQRTKLGSGYILSEASKDMRRIVNRSNEYFENAFYGGTGGGSMQGLQNGYGGQGGYQNGGYPADGYQNGFGTGSNNQYYGDGSGYQNAPNYAPGTTPGGMIPN